MHKIFILSSTSIALIAIAMLSTPAAAMERTGGKTVTIVKGGDTVGGISGAPAKTPPKTTTRVVRDHRGESSNQIAATSPRPGKKGFGDGQNGNVIVRDHRH